MAERSTTTSNHELHPQQHNKQTNCTDTPSDAEAAVLRIRGVNTLKLSLALHSFLCMYSRQDKEAPAAGDTVVLFAGKGRINGVTLEAGGTYCHRFGAFRHDDIIGG